MPKVSVILTSYNHGKYIQEAIDSVLNQTFTDFELIIWDDASSDNSWHLISQYTDPRIKLFRNDVQKRGIWGINKAIFEVSTGEYIAIHHSDDVWEPDKLLKQVNFLNSHREIGAVFTWAQIIDENDFYSDFDWFIQENKTQWQWLNLLFHERNHLNHPSVLIRKKCYQSVGGYRFGLAQTGDAEMWSRVLIKYPIHVIQERLTKHRLFSDRSNTCGITDAVLIRLSNEWGVLRENFLSISSFEDIVATFPILERYRNPKGFDTKFLLAMACLHDCTQHGAWQLGLKWLFELIKDEVGFVKIRELYSFNYIDFIKLTDKYDVYAICEVQDLNTKIIGLQMHQTEIDQQLVTFKEQRDNWEQIALTQTGHIAERDQQLANRDQQLANRDQQLTERDQQLTERDQQHAEKDRQLAELNQQLAELNQQLAERDQRLVERDQQLVERYQQLSERDQSLDEMNQRLVEWDHQLAKLNHQLDEINQNLAERDQQLSEKDLRLAEMNQRLVESDQQLAKRNHQLVERDDQIVSLRAIFDRFVIGKDKEILYVQEQLNHILQSRSWRVTAPLRNVVVVIRKIGEFLQNLFDDILGLTVRKIRNSSLFDADYYLANNPDVQNAGMDPAVHYLLHGWRENRNPSAAFSTSQYLFNNPDVAQAGVNPLIHYLTHGQQEGRSIEQQTSLSEVMASADSVHSVLASDQNLVELGGLPVAPNHVKVCDAVIKAEVEAIRKSGLFDESFYLSMYKDIQPTPSDPIRHYCEHGWREGRNPSDDFDTRFYLATYVDIHNAGINPFWHYVVAGASEQRQTVLGSSNHYENNIQFGVVNTDIKLLVFYSSPDWAPLSSGRPLFKGHLQPLIPHEELGANTSSDVDELRRQALMAKQHGLHGFCFHLDIDTDGDTSYLPVSIFLGHEDIDFRFCLQTVLCSEDIHETSVASLVRAVSDRRFICIKSRPVIVVTINCEIQHAATALSHLKRRLADQGFNPFLIGRWASTGENSFDAPLADLCDAVLDLPTVPAPGETGDYLPRDMNGVDVVPYNVVASQGIARACKAYAYPLYHSVTLGRDNSCQKPERPLVYTRFNVRDYRLWLDATIAGARGAHPEDRRFVFLNSWNAWNEGMFLEPDRQGGFSRINETTRALLDIPSGTPMPKVTVIVPNYNHERFLRKRLDSIYGQTYKNIEVILLDDCSSDQSRSLMDQYAAAYPDITRTLFNDQNSGSAFRQWAKGIKAATGELVWIAESDDYCDERFLEVLVRSFDDEAVLLAFSKCVFVNKDEVPLRDEFKIYLSDLECAEKWDGSYVETAHNEVRTALGIKNTIPNASGVIFKRPINMTLLNDESWLSMAVAGDWVFYLHIIRGGKIAYNTGATNFFRRYEGSTAEVTYKKRVYYREVGMASRTVAALYNVPLDILVQCRNGYKAFYDKMVGQGDEEFTLWYDYESILQAREKRMPNVLISTMGFYPGGAEILPIRLANEFKRQGLSVLLLNVGLMCPEYGVRQMLFNDVPIIETSDIERVKTIIHDFGVEVLNTHQWHVQKYPIQVSNVFDELRGHVASLHGMIEHGSAFGVTEDQLRIADQSVTTWVYTAEKNIEPFINLDLYDKSTGRFVKIPNGMHPPHVVPIPRADMGIPEDAFALCCVSRAISDKGWEETIQVVKQARALSGCDIRLILVGNGPVYDEYCQLGAPDFVYLAGFSENSVGHYAAADMGVMLTKFKSESFPLTIVDCLFAGKPYIATDVGDIRNMLTTSAGIAGEVIELEDWEIPIEKAAKVVAAFATDKQRYLNALALVQEVTNRYKIDVVASQYIRLFESSRDELRLAEKRKKS